MENFQTKFARFCIINNLAEVGLGPKKVMIQRNKRAISISSTRGVVDKEMNSESGGWWFKSTPGREKNENIINTEIGVR